MKLLDDARASIRSLVRTPGVTIVSLVALALGIGANVTVFTISSNVLFKGFPFDKSDRILYLLDQNVAKDQFMGISHAEFRDWQEHAKSFEGLALAGFRQTNLADDNVPEVYPTGLLTADAFRVIGQHPILGRDFVADDDRPGAAPVLMLTYDLWTQRYAKDPLVVGRTVRANGVVATIIGVMPPDVVFPGNIDLWMPLVPNAALALDKRENRVYSAFGRLRPNVTLAQARAEMATVAANLEREYPATNQNVRAVVRTYAEQYLGPQLRTMFIALFVAVGFVLLIVCANLANLQLARGITRSRDISIRLALGSSRFAIVRQLLVESVLLSLLGGALGCVLAIWGIRVFDLAVTPMGKPRWITFPIDGTVLLYLLVISVGAGVLFGVVPALRLSRLDLNSALKDDARGAGTGVRGKRLAALLVTAEMALALVLLVGAGLMVRSFLKVSRAQLGIDSSNVLTMRIELPARKYPKPEDQSAFHDHLAADLGALPGVDTVAIGALLPTGGSWNMPYELDGAPVDVQHRPTLSMFAIGPSYFKVWRVPVQRGRFFEETDTAAAPPVVMVNEAFAVRFWSGQDPLGRRLRTFLGSAPEPWRTVVGVVPNIVHNNRTPQQDPDPVVYVPLRQWIRVSGVAVMLRTRVPPGTLATNVRRAIETLDADVPIYNLWTMEERLLRNYWFDRLMGTLFAIFAGLALLVAAVGLYAIMANSVNQRTQEIGVRLAMGATARNIVGLVFTQGMRQVAVGVAIGLVIALALTRVLKAVLVSVSTSDPGTYIVASVILGLAAACGCLVPVRRATRIDPAVALHYE